MLPAAAALLAAALPAVSPAAAAGAGPKRGEAGEDPARLARGERGGSFTRADIEELDTLNPVTTRSRSVSGMLGLVFEGLLSRHPVTGMLQGGVARGYRVTGGGSSLEFDLERELRFSDGRPCTAEDVLFTFNEIYLNPEVDTRRNEVLRVRDSLVTLQRVDRHTVRMDLPVPYRPILSALTSLPVLPSHLLRPLIEEGGIRAFNTRWGSPQNGVADLVGTGPYRLAEVVPGDLLRLTRNPHYGRREGSLYLEGAPYLDEIVELLDLDRDTRLLMFQIGELDFYEAGDVDAAQGGLESLARNAVEGGYLLVDGGQSLRSNHFISFNLKPGAVAGELGHLFGDLRFRRAVSLLVDRERILREVYGGWGYLDGSPERDSSPFHLPLPPGDFDPGQAGELLDELGLSDRDGDGIRELPSGEPLGFTLLTNRENPLRADMGWIIVERLREAGVDARLEQAPYDQVTARLMVSFAWEAVLLGVEGRLEPNDSAPMWESRGTLHLWNPYQEEPATPWERRLDQLFALGRTTWELDRAAGYYHEYQRIAADRLPVIQVLTPAAVYGCRRGFGNLDPRPVTPGALGIMPFVYRERR
jgi:peptide/nickel transport system substrate-binding protein